MACLPRHSLQHNGNTTQRESLPGNNHTTTIHPTPMPSPDQLKMRLVSIGKPEIVVPAPKEMPIDPDTLKIQYSVNVIVNRPESLVQVLVSMAYMAGRTTVFNGRLLSSFEVVNLASYVLVNEEDESFQVESDFLPTLINVAFGTTRGYFAAETKGTALEPYPFPIFALEDIQKRTSYQLI